jgi:hypothetical protein
MGQNPDPEEENLSFTLLENGLDSVLESLRRLRGEPSPSDLKHSSLALWRGALLILKEKLRRKNWRLMAQKPDAIDENSYAAGTFIGPNFDTVLERLKTECDLELDKDFLGHLQGLRARRNRLEHFRINESRDEVISSTAQVAGDLLRFVGVHLEPDGLDGSEEELVRQIRAEISESEVMLEVHLEPVQGELVSAGLEALECPRCTQETFALEEPVRCRFCGFQGANGEARAEEYISNVLGVDRYRTVKDGGDWPQFECLECGAEAMVRLEADGYRYVCLECASTWPPGALTRCDRCGSLMERDDETTTCPDCWGAIFERE